MWHKEVARDSSDVNTRNILEFPEELEAMSILALLRALAEEGRDCCFVYQLPQTILCPTQMYAFGDFPSAARCFMSLNLTRP